MTVWTMVWGLLVLFGIKGLELFFFIETNSVTMNSSSIGITCMCIVRLHVISCIVLLARDSLCPH